jgi:hypothetical protein
MSDFRTRLLGFAALAMAFAGVSYGQTSITCAAGTNFPPNPTLRAESETELLGEYETICTSTGAGAVATSGAFYVTTSLPITSKTFTPAGAFTPVSEATLTVINAVGAVVYTTQGSVSGTQVSFQIGTTANPTPLPVGPFALVVDNIRVNASTGGAPQVTESGLLSYATTVGGVATSVNTSAAASTAGAGFILASLGPTSFLLGGSSAGGIAPAANYTVCQGNPTQAGGTIAAGTSFTVNISQLVGGAFKTLAGEGGVAVAAAPVGTGVATTATEISLTLGNIPTAATVYLPLTTSVTQTGTTTLSLANATAVGGSGPYAALASFTPSATGTVSVTYTVTAVGAVGAATFEVPVIVQFAANSAGAQSGSGAMNALVAYAPQATITGPATAIPTFAVTTGTPLGASTISLCQTTLMFPFITNQLGFDTGLVLANTSTDNLGFGGKSVAAPQSGTCTLNFYGAGTPSPSTGVADPMGSAGVTSSTANPNGPVHAFLLSSVAPGFQGYMIASCPFLYAHGYAFLAYNLTQSNGAVEGYLAEVLATGRSETILSGISPTFAKGGGALTALGSSTTTITDPTQF